MGGLVRRASNIQCQYRYGRVIPADDNSIVVDALRAPTFQIWIGQRLQARKLFRALGPFGGRLYCKRDKSPGVQTADDVRASIDTVNQVITEIAWWLEKISIVAIDPNPLRIIATLGEADEHPGLLMPLKVLK